MTIPGPLLFLIYINKLPDDMTTNAKLFAGNTSLFSIERDVNTSATHLNNDLRKISNWSFQQKMSFNPDPSKLAQLYEQSYNNTFHQKVESIQYNARSFYNNTHYIWFLLSWEKP